MRHLLRLAAVLLLAGCSGSDSPWNREAVRRDLSNDREAATRMCGVPTPGLEAIEMEPLPGREIGRIYIRVTGLPREVAEPRPRCEAVLEIMLWPKLSRGDKGWSLSYEPFKAYVSQVTTPGLSGGVGGRSHHHHHH